ncbi:tyrosyl-DNA phosphodiesterase-domain-containing protein [Echria macrotheca]|uniref:Tyrosyl-DNA phosphodiesterase-domain-containing protein n=1 Tax=Echria macrotheca TaxID=438768 RepID=A0AAJ0B4L6_9PEZI|nr:tyrosyl-DNA phosphodiesterase-domain-containing protein [Echria macrotheca]
MSDHNLNAYNGDKDEDEALNAAIALSLSQHASEKFVDLTSDNDDDSEAKTASASVPNKQPTSPIGNQRLVDPVPTGSRPPAIDETASNPVSGISLLGLDRKKMEEERIARLNKRKASEAIDTEAGTSDRDTRPSQRQKTSLASNIQASWTLPSSTPTPSAPPPSSLSSKDASPGIAHPTNPTPRPLPRSDARGASLSISLAPIVRPLTKPVKTDWPARVEIVRPAPLRLPYPRGAIKKTFVRGQSRTGDDITIEEVIQKDILQLAVFSSFQWDDEWLQSKVDLARTNIILVCYASDEDQQEQMRANAPSSRVRFCFPPMQGYGSMHSKLQLLKYENYLRIVVPSANLIPYDWGETGAMENLVFLIDLPRLQTDAEKNAQKLTPFAEELMHFMEAQEFDDRLVQSIRNYDLTATAHYAFVHSIAGSASDKESWKRTGYCGLGRAVKMLNLDTSGPIEVDYVCASLGAIKWDLLRALYFAFQGDSGLKEYQARTATGNHKQAALAGGEVDVLKEHIRIYFPSLKTVVESIGGVDSAGVICLPKRYWEQSTFPKELLYDCKSVRARVLMHTKVAFIRGASGSFAYVGSANLSESAWGRLVKDRVTKEPKFNCRNWECGVLVPASSVPSVAPGVAAGSPSVSKSQVGPNSLDVFRGIVPVPMKFPSVPIGVDRTEGKGPWFYRD